MSIDIYSRYLPLEEFLSIVIDLSVYLTIYVKATLSRHDPTPYPTFHAPHSLSLLLSSGEPDRGGGEPALAVGLPHQQHAQGGQQCSVVL